MGLAPIALFTYKRPKHTKLTLEALSKNHLAGESELFIFCDGPKSESSEEDRQEIERVRALVKEVVGFRDIHVVEQERNLGLGPSIIGGVTRILEKYPSVIVVEDDLLTAPNFLTYMNEALKHFQFDEKVMHVSGYMYPLGKDLPDYSLLRIGTCWGWATWARAWKHFNPDLDMLVREITDRNLWLPFDFDGTYPFSKQIEANLSGSMNTWAVKWYASFFLKEGLALHPGKSFVHNIGFDSSGENCAASDLFDVEEFGRDVPVFPKEMKIEENMKLRDRLKKFLNPHFGLPQTPQRPFWKKLLRKIVERRSSY